MSRLPWIRNDQTSVEDLYWDSVVRGEGSDVEIDPGFAQAITRVHALDDVPGPDPSFVAKLEHDLLRTMPFSISSASKHAKTSVCGAPHPWRDFIPTLRVANGRRRWAVAQLATALLLVFSTILAYLAFGPGSRDNEHPAAIPAVVSSPAGTIDEILLTVTFPAEALPHGDRISSGFNQITIPAASTGTWVGPPPNFCCLGLRLDYVIAGSYTVQAYAPVQVLRAGGNGTPMTIPTGEIFPLGPGDAMAYPFETTFHYMNSGANPVQMLFWTLYEGPSASMSGLVPPGWIINDQDVQIGWVTVPTGSANVRLRRVEIGQNSTIESPPGVTLQTGVAIPRNDEGTPISVFLGSQSDNTIASFGMQGVKIYVLTLEPTVLGGSASPTP
jgi:hypothetical protein